MTEWNTDTLLCGTALRSRHPPRRVFSRITPLRPQGARPRTGSPGPCARFTCQTAQYPPGAGTMHRICGSFFYTLSEDAENAPLTVAPRRRAAKSKDAAEDGRATCRHLVASPSTAALVPLFAHLLTDSWQGSMKRSPPSRGRESRKPFPGASPRFP